jgi:hypothetical protein
MQSYNHASMQYNASKSPTPIPPFPQYPNIASKIELLILLNPIEIDAIIKVGDSK